MQISYNIGALNNFAKFAEKHLCRGHILMNYRPHYLKPHLEETPAQIFYCVFGGIFKNVPLMIAPADSSILTKFLSTDHTFLFLYFLSIIASMVVKTAIFLNLFSSTIKRFFLEKSQLKNINCLKPTGTCKN